MICSKILPLSNFNLIFYWFFSASMASVGFMYDDFSVVLGSMLISPIISPITQISLNILTNNYSKVFYHLVISIIIIVASVLFGFLSGTWNFKSKTFKIPNQAMIKLTSIKHIFVNLLIGLMYGLAVSYSTIHDNLLPIIGFSLVVAVMPPLVNAGLFLSYHYFDKDNQKDNQKDLNYYRFRNSLLIGLANVVGVLISLLVGYRLFC
jgi:uncharacterized membrane protein